jgi:MFS family permease
MFRVERLLLLFSLAVAIVYFGEITYLTFIPLFLRGREIPLAEIGIFITAFYLTTALVSIPAGFISDRLGRNVILISLIALSPIVFSYTLAETKTQLLLLRALHGAAFAFIFPVARAYVMDKTTEENRGQTMGTYVLFMQLAGMMAPVLGGVVRDQTGTFDVLFCAAAVLPLVAVIFFVRIRVFAVLILMFVMLYFANGILTPILPIFAVEELGMSHTLLGFMFTCMGIIYAVGQYVAGTLSDQFGRKTLLVYPLFIYAVAVFVAGLSVNSSMFFATYMAIGIGVAAYATVAYSYIGDVVPPEQRGTASGVVASLSCMGMVFGPLLGSALGGIVGMRIPYFVCSLMVFLTILMLLIMLPSDKRNQ